jgi:hypothetical protein
MKVSIVSSLPYVRVSRRLRRSSPEARLRAGLVSALALCVPAAARPADPPADLVLTGGAVYTVDAARSWASAVAVAGERIVYVGDDAGARAFVGEGTRVLALGGRMLLPGFQDAHVHLMSGGLELLACDLNESANAEEMLARIRACAERRPGRDWLLGGGWDLPLFPGGNPGRELLDAIDAERPMHFDSADGHTSWVNSRALALAGVDRRTPDPPGGRIERDPATGEPTGTLRESAKDLVRRLLPEPTADDDARAVALAVERAHRFGITGVCEVSAGRRQLEAFSRLERAGQLNLHVTAALQVDPGRGVEQLADLLALGAGSWGGEIRPTAAKLFADGVLEAQTAALLEPYAGLGGARGELVWSEARLAEIATALDRAGFQLHVHAIGDRAIRATLDAIEIVAEKNGPRDRRPTLAHIQLFAPPDIPRFRRLGAAASFQPLWAYEDAYIRDLTVPFLGPERARWLYPMASVARTGAILAGGSDWSVSAMNPLLAIEVALTRRSPEDPAGAAWIPEERVDLATMLAAYTIGSAWASFRERETGSIEPGKLGDLALLDRNLFEIAPTEISEARVLLTLFRGREVWRDPVLGSP